MQNRQRWMWCISLEMVLLTIALPARAATGSIQSGVYVSDVVVQERLVFSDTVNVLTRQPVWVPDSYGKLITITPQSDEQVILWFQADDGAIRNIVLPSQKPFVLRRGGSFSTKDESQ